MQGDTHTKRMSIREWIETENAIWVELLVFVLGGVTYGLIEILFRGHTHWTMVVTGGACVVTLYILLDWLGEQPLVLAALTGALIVTVYEFAVGCMVNLYLGWKIWDYSDMEGNLLGQICPAYTAAWFMLCFLFLGLIRLLS